MNRATGPVTVAVVAKECRPGRVKTRLCPPLTPGQAARVAQAALDDTLDAVRASGGLPLIYLDGAPPASAAGFAVLPQCQGPFDERLAHLFDTVNGPLVLVGMDTPQLDAGLLQRLASPWPAGVDAWFGAARDGGFWLLAMARPDGRFLRGVEMSTDATGTEVRARLDAAGLVTLDVPSLVDVDTVDDALSVAVTAPGSRFASALRDALALTGVAP